MEEKETREWFMFHFDYDPTTGRFTNRRSGVVAAHQNPKGYILLKGPRKKNFYAHRVAFLIMEGYWPEQIDHRNRIRNDNRWDNLRQSDQFLNSWNHSLRKTNGTGQTGVEFCGRREKFRASLVRNHTRKRGPWRETFEQAKADRLAMESEWQAQMDLR